MENLRDILSIGTFPGLRRSGLSVGLEGVDEESDISNGRRGSGEPGFACLLTFRIDPFGLTDGGNPLRRSLFHGLNRTLENLDTCIDVHAYPVASVLFESLYFAVDDLLRGFWHRRWWLGEFR